MKTYISWMIIICTASVEVSSVSVLKRAKWDLPFCSFFFFSYLEVQFNGIGRDIFKNLLESHFFSEKRGTVTWKGLFSLKAILSQAKVPYYKVTMTQICKVLVGHPASYRVANRPLWKCQSGVVCSYPRTPRPASLLKLGSLSCSLDICFQFGYAALS